MNFIEELYYGNINPNEKRYDGHTDYAKAMRRFCNSENELNKMGYPTALNFDGTTEIRMIQGVAAIPAGFGKVVDASFENETVTFKDITGKTASVKCNYNFVMA